MYLRDDIWYNELRSKSYLIHLIFTSSTPLHITTEPYIGSQLKGVQMKHNRNKVDGTTVYSYKNLSGDTEGNPRSQREDEVISDEMNQSEMEWFQHQNKIIQDKIDDAYYNSMKRLNHIQGLIIEEVMRKHKKDEGNH